MEPWQILLLLGVVIVLYAKVFLKQDTSLTTPLSNISEQLEETFETFAYEMEEENKQIMKHIVQLKQEYEEKTLQLTKRIEVLEGAHSETTPEASTIRLRYHELMAHKKAGKSIDWISKATGMPEGEVQLILKLAEQEEMSHA